MAHVAHVACFSEGEVVVEAPLAGPVTNSLLVSGGFVVFLDTVEIDGAVFIGNIFVLSYFFATFLFRLGHVLWLAIAVICALGLLASVTSFATLKVVVLALVAFPASIWESEGWLS